MNQSILAIRQSFQTGTDELLALVRSFQPAAFVNKPEDGGWSALEVAEHLLIFDRHLNRVVASLDKQADRDPLQKVGAYTPRVTNLETKLQAPPFLEPTGESMTPEEMAGLIEAERTRIMQQLDVLDITMISSTIPHRLFGEMTGMEWINFINMHTKRHIPQLQRLLGNSVNQG